MNRRLHRFVFVFVAVALVLAIFSKSRVRARLVGVVDPPGRTIHGEVVLKPRGTPFANADLIVTVEDVSIKDVAARYLIKKTFKNIAYDGHPETRLRFTLEDLKPEPKHRYQVRILLDLDRNGRISRGDYRSIRPAAVFTSEKPDPLVIEAELKRE